MNMVSARKIIPVMIMFFLIGLMGVMMSALCCRTAYARPDKSGNWNFNETTGLINMPTARSIESRKIKVSIRMARLGKGAPIKKAPKGQSGGSWGKPWDSDWWINNDGDRHLLIAPLKNFEIGAMNIHSYTIAPAVGAKWVFLQETTNCPAFAIGAGNLTAMKEDSNVKNKNLRDVNSKVAPYIVASKSFGKEDNLDLSVGFGGGRFRNRVFYGGELFLDKKKIWSLVGEYNGNVSGYGVKIRPYQSRWDFGAFMQDVDSPGVTISYTLPF